MRQLIYVAVLLLFVLASPAAEFHCGSATVDITPGYPVRLSGYAVRKSESEGVRERIFAKALAISQGDEQALVLTIDTCGISREIWNEITTGIQQKHSIPPERIVIFSSHTHYAPC